MADTEPALDFDSYWKAWLASRLAEIQERAMQQNSQAEAPDQEY